MKTMFNPEGDAPARTGFGEIARLGEIAETADLAIWIGKALSEAGKGQAARLLCQEEEGWTLYPGSPGPPHKLEADDPLVLEAGGLKDAKLLRDGLLEEGLSWTAYPLTSPDSPVRAMLLLQDMPPADLLPTISIFAERLLLRGRYAAFSNRAREMEEQQANFMNIVNHELRTPLTAILGFADLAVNLPSSREDQTLRQFIEGISFSAKNLNQRIGELLTMGGISAAALHVERDACPLPELLEEFRRDTLPELAGHERVGLPVEIPDMVLRADRLHFHRILTHLVDNALKFSEEGKSVRLQFGVLKGRRASDTGDYLRVDVIDEGPGISESEREKIFEKFYQVEDSSTRSRGGMGLGLALAREFTEAMGGKLWFASEVGRGSTFSFTLPLID